MFCSFLHYKYYNTEFRSVRFLFCSFLQYKYCNTNFFLFRFYTASVRYRFFRFTNLFLFVSYLLQFLNSFFLRLQFLLDSNFCRLLFFRFRCIKIFVISVFIKRRFGLCSFLDFGTFVSIFKYLLFLYSLNRYLDSARFWTLKLLFLYSNICYSLFNFFFVLQFYIKIFVTVYSKKKKFCTVVFHSVRYYKKKKNCYSFVVFVSIIHLLHFFVSVRIQILNMFCFYLSEMASPSTPVNFILNHGEKPERFNGTDFKR